MKDHTSRRPRSLRVFSAILLLSAWSLPAQAQKTYTVHLADPVKPELPVKNYTLELQFDDAGLPVTYRMELITDVCLDRVCNILEATLVWDALGAYQGIEYKSDNPLTKGDHEPFTADDYRKLDRIIKDRHSLLGRHPLDYFLVKPVQPNEVDGVTAATPQELADAVVGGAAYSTWALWHWVNGEVQDSMLEITRTHCSDDYLLHCLHSSGDHFVKFALRELAGKEAVDARFMKPCIGILEADSENSCRLALEVLAQVESDQVPLRMAQTVGVNSASTRLILEQLKTVKRADAKAWEALAGQLALLTEYQDVAIALELLSQHAQQNKAVRTQVEQLIERGEPLITYRAKKFLTQ